MMQRLLEIETYRILALLALPIACELTPVLSTHERGLSRITEALVAAKEADEPVPLDGLTRLAAEIDSRDAAHHFRFSAARAYYDLVQQCIDELREERIHGLQTCREFTERRLAPAMRHLPGGGCASGWLVAPRRAVDSIAVHPGRLTRERQNRAVLKSMNRRAQLQLRLARSNDSRWRRVTYYVVGLIGYAEGALGGRAEAQSGAGDGGEHFRWSPAWSDSGSACAGCTSAWS